MTLTMFERLYQHYKDMFDLEMQMTAARLTYKTLWIRSQKDEEWF